MSKVKVTYTGDRTAKLRYMVRPGGITYTARGYVFSAKGSSNLVLDEEAAVLADLDAPAKDKNGNAIKKIVGGKEVAVLNRECVTVANSSPLSKSDTFDVAGAKVAKKTTEGDKK